MALPPLREAHAPVNRVRSGFALGLRARGVFTQ